MKSRSRLALAVVICLALLTAALPLSSCGQAYSPENPLVIDYESWLPTAIPDMDFVRAYYKGLEDATGGAVKVEFHMAGAMGPGPETYGRVIAGISDIGHFAPGYIAGTFPMFEIHELPISFPTSEVFTQAMIKLLENGYFDDDFAEVVPMAFYSIAPYVLYSTKKATTIADLKGLKLRCPGPGWVEITKALGAVPVTMSSAEVYLTMQKGIVDGVWNPPDGVFVYKFHEVGKYYINTSFCTVVLVVTMNKDAWEELPKAGKDYIEANWKSLCLGSARTYDVTASKATNAFLTMDGLPGREVLTFAPAEYEKMHTLFAPIWSKWIADREAKGLPAKEAVNDLYKFLRDLGVEKPYIGYTPAG